MENYIKKKYIKDLTELFDNDSKQALEVADVFLTARAAEINFNQPDAKGRTLLMAACLKGANKTVRNLVQSGADIEIMDNEGLKAINYAKLGKNEIGAHLLYVPTAAPTLSRVEPLAPQNICCTIS